MRNPWRILTGRGRVFLIAGLVLTVAMLAIGQRDVVWLGLLLLILPIVALILIGRSKLQLSCERRLSEGQVALGDEVTGELLLSKSGAHPSGLLQFEDRVPPELGIPTRFSIHHAEPNWTRDIAYTMYASKRGRFQTGPLMIRSVDPFGLVRTERRFKATSEVLVTPRIHILPSLRQLAGTGAQGDTSPQRLGVTGQDDILIREYRHGDDVRRVHWRHSARRGELMVRREEQSWDPSINLLLDNRLANHTGEGEHGSFEWAVSAAASISKHFVQDGYSISVFDSSGVIHDGANDPGHPAARDRSLLLQFIDIDVRNSTTMNKAMDAITTHRQGQMLVAVLGRITAQDAQQLVRAGRTRGQGVAIVLEVDSWVIRSQRASSEAQLAHKDGIRVLREAGWKVAVARHNVTVPQAWQQLEALGVGA
ncbi:DUF58 domain-containing protein [Parenemella sanctibonifatiensis]|uniref:DUF58 domain-containing protein n=1 Tax=Parenemella sanctibonifatiensis TaxID=2016505 RepID=A0A255EFX5_9ACTN|nr:DUF58 domain-containing protein [Parenemella sanctibonifatiensis]